MDEQRANRKSTIAIRRVKLEKPTLYWDMREEDGLKMHTLADESVDLIVTSPPYNVGMEYEAETERMEFYNRFIRPSVKSMWRVLTPGGRACIVTANTGRNPYIPLHVDWVHAALQGWYDEVGKVVKFGMRGEIIWDKGVAGTSTAWGSWLEASNPSLRDNHEYIIVLQKLPYSKPDNRGFGSSLEKEEFLEWTKSLWKISAESKKKIGHPAPYPVEIPHRLIRLYSHIGDLVVDPFAGSGTTGVAAKRNDRCFVGMDLVAEYVELAKSRIEKEQTRMMV